ncbi:MAG: hypothetical protein SNJ57_09320 [Cyanobacteriota bacterium]
MTQSSSLSARVSGDRPDPVKLQHHQERNRRYRHQNPDKVRISVRKYAASPAGKLARQRANERSKAWAKTIRFLNRETPEVIAQRFPFLSVAIIMQHRPVDRTSIKQLLPELELLQLRRAAALEAF